MIDLVIADEEGIDAGDNFEQVSDSLGGSEGLEMFRFNILVIFMSMNKVLDIEDVDVLIFRDAVKFSPVACRDNQSFGE